MKRIFIKRNGVLKDFYRNGVFSCEYVLKILAASKNT